MHYKFKLLPLPYAYDALEPYIDARTMEIHHDKHVQAYVDNLNKALEPYPEFHSWSLEKLLFNLGQLPEEIRPAVRNNAGGVYNHNIYFSILAQGKSPSGLLLDAINKKWGSVDSFKAELKQAGLTQFGSGWAWLVATPSGDLQIKKSANQDAPICKCNFTPVINLDVWEHAYYLKVQNRRGDYIDNFFNVVDWDKATENYAKYAQTDYLKA